MAWGCGLMPGKEHYNWTRDPKHGEIVKYISRLMDSGGVRGGVFHREQPQHSNGEYFVLKFKEPILQKARELGFTREEMVMLLASVIFNLHYQMDRSETIGKSRILKWIFDKHGNPRENLKRVRIPSLDTIKSPEQKWSKLQNYYKQFKHHFPGFAIWAQYDEGKTWIIKGRLKRTVTK
jgi:hypothetical protein